MQDDTTGDLTEATEEPEEAEERAARNKPVTLAPLTFEETVGDCSR